MKILLDFDGTLTNIEQEYEFECRYIMSELKREFGLDEETINALFDVAKAHVADNACEHGWCDNDRISAYCDEDLFMTVASTMTLLDKWLAAADERADVLRKHGVAGATPMMDLTQRAHAAINAEPLSAFNTPEPVVVKAIHELKKLGLVTQKPYAAIELTVKGARVAKQVLNRHTLLRSFLMKLGVSRRNADKDACLMEHILSAETIDRIRSYTENSKTE